MALEILTTFGGVLVTVIIQDSRPSDVAIALLHEDILRSELPKGGAVYLPSRFEPEKEHAYQQLADMGIAKARYLLELDTSALPFGLLQFAFDRFINQVAAAVDRGEHHIRLSRDTAEQWGYQAVNED